MKTDDLINMLASGDIKPQPIPILRIATHITLGLLVTIALMMTFLGVRENLLQVLMLPAFWMKFIFVIALASIGLIAARRLSSPGGKTNRVPAMLAVPIVIIWSIAAVSLMTAAPGERAELFWGDTWKACPFVISGLSIPIFIAILSAMRELAPTRLRLAGAAAGLTAGAAAAAVYCLHCPEMAAPFVGFWYLLGILIPALIGTLIGPRALSW
ncbi:Uncharacterized conserved protein [Janthinobacterium sp. Marseille]|uniref:NrsF family protein n=1 Tax=Herminiimonas aquatilis TaxID=345342 RepID=A0ABW2J5S5_9BURK|nr:DUF1109 domain-containing protein [Janthinobacterium sp. Marseille]ABR90139.1 Uncharacterized conserved protein [Janthinobacterium sp. Marseille]